MSASRYAIVRDGVVEQITLWDPEQAPNWTPPAGTIAIPCPDDLHLYATHDGSKFTQPAPKPRELNPVLVGPDGLTDDERATLKELVSKVTK